MKTSNAKSTGTHPEPISPESLAEALADLLNATRMAYESLLSGIAEHREAVRTAQPAHLPRAVDVQDRAVKALMLCEGRRRTLALRVTGSLAQLSAMDPAKLTLSEMVKGTPAALQPELEVLASTVRELGKNARDASGSLRSATSTLVAHMEGLVRQVERTLSHAGVYSKRGVVEAGVGVVSALDIRS